MMTYQPAGANGERVPSGGPTPGALAEQAAWARYEAGRIDGPASDGIYNPRPIRGTGPGTGKPAVWSLHAVGRAIDNHANAHDPAEKKIAEEWIDLLIANASTLGVQYLIWNRRSWRPDRGWRDYGGVDPHDHHVHVELDVAGAAIPHPLWATLGAVAPKPSKPPKPTRPKDDDMIPIAYRDAIDKKVWVVSNDPKPLRWHVPNGTDLAHMVVLGTVKVTGTNGAPKEVEPQVLASYAVVE